MNARTPAGANGEGSAKSVSLVGDTLHVAHTTPKIQTDYLRQRFALSPSVAAVIAGLAFTAPETWRAGR